MNKKLSPTGYWTFICNPVYWAIDKFLESGETEDTFSIRKSDKDSFNIGDLGIIRVGRDDRTKKQLNGRKKLKPGIYAVVEVTGQPKLMASDNDGYWYEASKGTEVKYRVPIKYIHNLLDSPIYLEDLGDLGIEKDKYLIDSFQGSSIPLKSKTFKDITNTLYNLQTGQEVTNPSIFREGNAKQITVNVYERNPVARRKCIEHYGCSCMVCGFDFERVYGEVGKGYIHVHHLLELNQIGEEYEVDPIKDLRPVCPNCHAMVHKRKPAYSIEFLQQMMKDYNT